DAVLDRLGGLVVGRELERLEQEIEVLGRIATLHARQLGRRLRHGRRDRGRGDGGRRGKRRRRGGRGKNGSESERRESGAHERNVVFPPDTANMRQEWKGTPERADQPWRALKRR